MPRHTDYLARVNAKTPTTCIGVLLEEFRWPVAESNTGHANFKDSDNMP
jgi:hypothetical protein